MKSISICCLLLAASAAANESWTMHDVEDGYATAKAMRQDSSVAVPDENPANEVVPQLEFRCSSGSSEISARIDWHRFISSFSTEAGFKVDDGRFTWLKWKVDSSESITISPNAADSQKLVDLLAGGSRLQVEITPYSASPIVAEFDLSGFSKALKRLCN